MCFFGPYFSGTAAGPPSQATVIMTRLQLTLAEAMSEQYQIVREQITSAVVGATTEVNKVSALLLGLLAPVGQAEGTLPSCADQPPTSLFATGCSVPRVDPIMPRHPNAGLDVGPHTIAPSSGTVLPRIFVGIVLALHGPPFVCPSCR